MTIRAWRCGVCWLAPDMFRPRFLVTGYRVFPAEPGDPEVESPTLLADAIARAAEVPHPVAQVATPEPRKRGKKRRAVS